MAHAYFRFYAELNDFLPPHQRFVTFAHTLRGNPTAMDLIQALGVPHADVELVLANGQSVDFTYRVQDGDRIAVYPVFEAIDISPALRVRSRPLRVPRFVVDSNLERLARYLRLLGFDTLHGQNDGGEECVRTSIAERRILLTLDPGLLKRGDVTHGHLMRERVPRQQVIEVLRRCVVGWHPSPGVWRATGRYGPCARKRLATGSLMTCRMPGMTCASVRCAGGRTDLGRGASAWHGSWREFCARRAESEWLACSLCFRLAGASLSDCATWAALESLTSLPRLAMIGPIHVTARWEVYDTSPYIGHKR